MSKFKVECSKLDYVKEMYLKCLEHFECGECTEHYKEVKNAYDNFNKLNKDK